MKPRWCKLFLQFRDIMFSQFQTTIMFSQFQSFASLLLNLDPSLNIASVAVAWELTRGPRNMSFCNEPLIFCRQTNYVFRQFQTKYLCKVGFQFGPQLLTELVWRHPVSSAGSSDYVLIMNHLCPTWDLEGPRHCVVYCSCQNILR